MSSEYLKKFKLQPIEMKSLRKKTFNAFTKLFHEFASFTSIHGIKNISNDFRFLNKPSTRSKFSNSTIRFAKCFSIIVWGGVITIAFLLSILMTIWIWQRSQNTPTLTTIDTYYYPIWNVPFPAVTFCNINVVYRPAMEQLMRKFTESGFNETAIRKVFRMLHVMIRHTNFDGTDEVSEFKRALNQFNLSIENLMLNLMQPCNRMIIHCVWLNKAIPCDELFQVSKTSKGFCCSFNYEDIQSQFDRPGYFLSGAGVNVGLELILSPEPNEYVSYIRSFHGIQVAVHSDSDFPDMNNLILVQPGYDSKLFITPSVLTAEEIVRDLSISKRNCLFSDEKKTEILNKYTYNSCMIDCRVENIVKLCNCIPYYYPYFHLANYSNVSMCGFDELTCLRRIRARISSTVPPQNAVGFERYANKASIGLKCDCVPQCEETRYSFQAHQANRQRSPVGHINNSILFDNRTTLNDVTTIFIAFKDITCVAYKRTVYMTWDDFFALVGGIIGLFLGASIISFIEVLYFFIIHILGRTIYFALPMRPKVKRKTRSMPSDKKPFKNVYRLKRRIHSSVNEFLR